MSKELSRNLKRGLAHCDMPPVESKSKKRRKPRSSKYRKRVLRAYGNVCYYCGITCYTEKEHQDSLLYLTVEHLIPVAFGGSHNIENLRPACYGCNQEKARETSDKVIEENAD